MDNLKKYSEYILEMKIIDSNINNNENQSQITFTKNETDHLVYNEPFKFDIVQKNKAIAVVEKYKLSIYKSKTYFLYRVRDISKAFGPVLLENKANSIRDCLYKLDEFMWERLKIDKEKREINKKKKMKSLTMSQPKETKERPDIFSFKKFSSIGHF